MGLREIVLLAALAVTGCHSQNNHNYASRLISVVYYFSPDTALEPYPDHIDFMEKVEDRFKHKVHLIPRCTAKDGNVDENEKCWHYKIGRTGASVNGSANWNLMTSEGYGDLPVVIADGKRVKNPSEFCEAIGEAKTCLD